MKYFIFCISLLPFFLNSCIVGIDVDGETKEVPSTPQVNTYVQAPESVLRIIEPYVRGYESPSLYRYNKYLYPTEIQGDRYNLPCYVRSDFNGDGRSDYAFLFSKAECGFNSWTNRTKFLMVLSTPFGHKLCCNITLGEVEGTNDKPIGEFWSIRWIPKGKHILKKTVGNKEIIKEIILDNESIYLASLQENEESIIHARYDEVFRTEWYRSGRICIDSAERRTAPFQYPAMFNDAKTPLLPPENRPAP